MYRFCLYLSLLLLAGCTTGISREVLNHVDRSAAYPLVKANIQRYIGTIVAWGGYVHQTRNTPEGTYIEVIEAPLNAGYRPLDMDKTRGRFLILYPGFAEPARYSPGKAVTVVGEVRGVQERPLGETDYAYPVILRQFDRLWKPRTRPDVHLGIGVGTVFTH